MFQKKPWVIFLVLCGITVSARENQAQAQIIPDKNLGNENSIVTPVNSVRDRIDGGAIRNNNLFHSFTEFNIGEGREAYFSNPAAIENIFSRVSGSNPSQIFGKLGVLGDANLFLLNPNGILFGENSSLDIKGSFFASTASSFDFGEGKNYSAINPTAPPLLSVNVKPVVGLEFEGEGDIENRGNLIVGKDLTLQGNNIDFQENLVAARDFTLIAKNNINLTSSYLSSESLLGGNINLKSGNNISLNNTMVGSASVNSDPSSSSETGGNINVNAGKSLFLSQASALGTFTYGMPNAGDVNIQALESVSVDGIENFPGISSLVLWGATGNGGNVNIKTGELQLRNGGQISATTFAKGNAGNIDIKAKFVEITGSNATGQFPSGILSNVENTANGNGGNLTVDTESFLVADRAQLSISTFGNGNAGDFIINATNFKAIDGGQILAIAFGTKDGGTLKVTADSIELIGTDTTGRFPSGFRATNASDSAVNGGDLTINTEKLLLRDGAQISVSTFDRGNTGNLSINAKSIQVIGESVDTQFLRLSGLFAQINPEATGNAGNLNIATENLKVADGAQISVNNLGDGSAGDLTIKATSSLEVIGRSSDGEFPSGLFAEVGFGSFGNDIGRRGKGTGGNLTIETGSLRIINGALVAAGTSGEGDAGSLDIKANSIEILGKFPNGTFSLLSSGVDGGAIGNGGDLTITTNSLKIAEAGIGVRTFGEGKAGNFQLQTDSLLITDGGFISASTSGEGNAGKMTINASEIDLFGTNKNGISTKLSVQVNPQATGDAGSLIINTETLNILNGAKISANTFGNGDAGIIDINADKLNIRGNGSEISAITFSQGIGGNIFVFADEFWASQGGQIRTTTSSSEKAGNITLNIKDNLALTGEETGIFANTTENSTGKGGSIIIDPEVVNIFDGARISVDSQGIGEGGDIELAAGNLNLDNGGITAETRSDTGGDITLNIQDLLLLRNNSQISTTAGNEQFGGDGGSININTPDGFIVAFPNENSDITANAFSGDGGKVDITAFGVFGIEFRDQPTSLSDITASSRLASDGEVNIETPGIEPNPETVELAQDIQSTEVAQGCQASGQAAVAFFNIGRGGLPQQPGETLNSEDVIANWIPLVMEEESKVDKKISRATKKKIANTDCKNY